jgi:transcription elongation GreA/GreB family factor
MSELLQQKQDLIAFCAKFIEDQINHVQTVINSAKESAQNESKSSAGDKHETGKSLMQLEQENNAKLLDSILGQKRVISLLQEHKNNGLVSLGSLIETNKGVYYIGIGIGLVELNMNKYFVISPSAPVGKLFIGKQMGDTITFNGKSIQITNLA